MDLDLSGKKVLITGGSKGIGLEIARQFASEGCSLGLVSRSNQDLLEAKNYLESQYGVKVETLELDLSKRGPPYF